MEKACIRLINFHFYSIDWLSLKPLCFLSQDVIINKHTLIILGESEPLITQNNSDNRRFEKFAFIRPVIKTLIL